MISNEEIGLRIKSQREEKEMTLQDIADKVGVAKSTIQRYESGTINNIKIPVVYAIAKSLGVNPSWLVGKSDVKKEGVFKNTGDEIHLFSNAEQEHIKKYRSIDDKGKHTVDTVLEMEYSRCNRLHIISNAAHDNGATEEQKKHTDGIMNNDELWK